MSLHGNDQATGPSEAAGDGVAAALVAARQHLQAERLPDARLACEQALRLDSACAQAWNLLGGVAWRGGNLESAVEQIGKATTLDPGNGEFWCNLAGAQGALKRMDEAARSMQSAIEADPSNAGIHSNLGNLYREQGKFEAAVACYRRALEIDPLLAGTHNSLGYSLFRQGDLRGAIGPYRRSLELKPDNPHLLNRLGAIYLDLQAYDEAASCFRRALDLDPNFVLALNNLGNTFRDQDRFEEAIEQFRRANEIDPGFAEPYANLGSIYLRLGEPRAALAASEDALRLAPGICSVLAYKAFAHLSLGEEPLARALLDYQRLVSVRHIDPPEGYGSLAEFNQALGQQILANPTLRNDPAGKTTTIGRQTGELIGEEGPFAALEAITRKAFAAYLENLPQDETHPYLAQRLGRFAMAAWAVVLDNRGYQEPHIHPWAWASAVYYAKLPSTITDGDAETTTENPEPPGWIEFGRPKPGVAADPPPWLRQVRPEEGLLVIFPSYFWHRTIPFESEETRISVAFDAFSVD